MIDHEWILAESEKKAKYSWSIFLKKHNEENEEEAENVELSHVEQNDVRG
jgi:hypothetical protein